MSQSLLLTTAGFTKWSNNDGDIPEGWRSVFAPVLPDDATLGQQIDNEREHQWEGDWKKVLFDLYQELLVPLIPEKVELYFMSTAHNPVRVRSVDGVPVPMGFDYMVDGHKCLITPTQVDVPIETIKEYMLRHGKVGSV